MTKKQILGYECYNCGLKSNKRIDWIITEKDVRCKKCNSRNVYPIDIDKGVILE